MVNFSLIITRPLIHVLRTLDELDTYTPGCDNNSYNNVINLRLDSLILDIKVMQMTLPDRSSYLIVFNSQWNVQMNMNIRKDTQIRPRIASSVTSE